MLEFNELHPSEIVVDEKQQYIGEVSPKNWHKSTEHLTVLEYSCQLLDHPGIIQMKLEEILLLIMVAIIVISFDWLNPVYGILLVTIKILIKRPSLLMQSSYKCCVRVLFINLRRCLLVLPICGLSSPTLPVAYLGNISDSSLNVGDDFLAQIRIIWASVLYGNIGIKAVHVYANLSSVEVGTEYSDDRHSAD